MTPPRFVGRLWGRSPWTAADALGSAQRLANGDYEFLSGAIYDGQTFRSEATEVVLDTISGTMNFQYTVAAEMYRTYRMQDLYTPEY